MLADPQGRLTPVWFLLVTTRKTRACWISTNSNKVRQYLPSSLPSLRLHLTPIRKINFTQSCPPGLPIPQTLRFFLFPNATFSPPKLSSPGQKSDSAAFWTASRTAMNGLLTTDLKVQGGLRRSTTTSEVGITGFA